MYFSNSASDFVSPSASNVFFKPSSSWLNASISILVVNKYGCIFVKVIASLSFSACFSCWSVIAFSNASFLCPKSTDAFRILSFPVKSLKFSSASFTSSFAWSTIYVALLYVPSCSAFSSNSSFALVAAFSLRLSASFISVVFCFADFSFTSAIFWSNPSKSCLSSLINFSNSAIYFTSFGVFALTVAKFCSWFKSSLLHSALCFVSPTISFSLLFLKASCSSWIFLFTPIFVKSSACSSWAFFSLLAILRIFSLVVNISSLAFFSSNSLLYSWPAKS